MIDKQDYAEPLCPFDSSFYNPRTENALPHKKIDVLEVISALDRLYAREKFNEAGEYLRKMLKTARSYGDKNGELSILNELLGFYRQYGEENAALGTAEECIELLKYTGIEGSLSAGTILLNIATVWKRFGRSDKAMSAYSEAFRCYKKHMPAEDIRFAGLYNNMAAAFLDYSDYDMAEKYYNSALKILIMHNSLLDLAVTYVNLAQLYHEIDPTDIRVPENIEMAMSCFDNPALERGSYYAYTCRKCASSFGYFGFYFYEKELNERADLYYERA